MDIDDVTRIAPDNSAFMGIDDVTRMAPDYSAFMGIDDVTRMAPDNSAFMDIDDVIRTDPMPFMDLPVASSTHLHSSNIVDTPRTKLKNRLNTLKKTLAYKKWLSNTLK